MNYRRIKWDSHEDFCYDVIKDMEYDKYVPDCIVGLLRGGVVPARVFSDYFNILLDFYAIDVKSTDGINDWKEKVEIREFNLELFRGKRILVVDDIWDTGQTMQAVLKELEGEDVTTATLFLRHDALEAPSYYSEVAKKDEWIVFPWEKREFERETGLKFDVSVQDPRFLRKLGEIAN